MSAEGVRMKYCRKSVFCVISQAKGQSRWFYIICIKVLSGKSMVTSAFYFYELPVS